MWNYPAKPATVSALNIIHTSAAKNSKRIRGVLNAFRLGLEACAHAARRTCASQVVCIAVLRLLRRETLERLRRAVPARSARCPARASTPRRRHKSTMASYSTMNTIPADVESEATLLNKPPKASSKVLIGGAALAAFVLGALAATAVDLKAPVRSTTFAGRPPDSDALRFGSRPEGCEGRVQALARGRLRRRLLYGGVRLQKIFCLQVPAADDVPRQRGLGHPLRRLLGPPRPAAERTWKSVPHALDKTG